MIFPRTAPTFVFALLTHTPREVLGGSYPIPLPCFSFRPKGILSSLLQPITLSWTPSSVEDLKEWLPSSLSMPRCFDFFFDYAVVNQSCPCLGVGRRSFPPLQEGHPFFPFSGQDRRLTKTSLPAPVFPWGRTPSHVLCERLALGLLNRDFSLLFLLRGDPRGRRKRPQAPKLTRALALAPFR